MAKSIEHSTEACGARPEWLWDHDMDEDTFTEILLGVRTIGRLDSRWAARRLLEYGSYDDIIRIIGFSRLAEHWHEWRDGMRSHSRREGLDFLVDWLSRRSLET